MAADDDYQKAMAQIDSLAASTAASIVGTPTAMDVCDILSPYKGSICSPLTKDLSGGKWKTWGDWMTEGVLLYLSRYGTSACVTPLRQMAEGLTVTDLATQSGVLADQLATLGVAVSEAKQLSSVKSAATAATSQEQAKTLLLVLSKLDPDWSVRASEIQKKLYDLGYDSFPALYELSDGKLSEKDVLQGLVAALFDPLDKMES